VGKHSVVTVAVKVVGTATESVGVHLAVEDDERWRYLFNDGKMEEQNAELIWR
jgi:hypothetical protein